MTDHLLYLLSIANEWPAVGWTMLVLAYAATQILLIPRSALSLAAGALFGIAAIPLVAAGTTFGAVIAFLLARYFVSERARRWIEGRERPAKILDAVDAEGWRLVAVSRCGAPLPSAVVNYAFGLTHIHLWSFTWATFVFGIPQAALFLYLGAAGRSMLSASVSPEDLLPLALGGVSSALAVYLLSSRLRVAKG